ncbi:MAG: zinc ABC transporter substrate-binding protein [Clostridia bacterium]|nr:zinc ABC transporter substrate-binding protein [Clostridia bacterium]
MKKTISLILCIVLAISFCACGKKAPEDTGKLKITATIFPLYDFARQIAGDKAEVKMLLPTGAEVHSYEPSPRDIITVRESDLFINLGMDSDPWTLPVINDAKGLNVLSVMEGMDVLNEKHHHHEGSVDIDPHIWTSPKNVKVISEKICDKLSSLDTENAQYYRENTQKYIEKLNTLDEKFIKLTDKNNRKIVFADRFPFKYFADAYNIEYYAAFPGCSSESEPSAATVATLIDTIKKEKIPVVFYTETSNKQLAKAVCEETGAEMMLFHSCHSVNDEELRKGITYLDLMGENYKVLQKAI